mgnify:CR=1 FL=1
MDSRPSLPLTSPVENTGDRAFEEKKRQAVAFVKKKIDEAKDRIKVIMTGRQDPESRVYFSTPEKDNDLIEAKAKVDVFENALREIESSRDAVIKYHKEYRDSLYYH